MSLSSPITYTHSPLVAHILYPRLNPKIPMNPPRLRALLAIAVLVVIIQLLGRDQRNLQHIAGHGEPADLRRGRAPALVEGEAFLLCGAVSIYPPGNFKVV